MKAGIYFPPIKTNADLLCDGHHRYLASLLSETVIEQIPATISPSTKVIVWKNILFEEEDWDTEAKIEMLNEQDALFNDMTLERLLALLE